MSSTGLSVTHKKRGKFGRQSNPMPADDIATDPDYQQTILRLGLSVGDINAKDINRVQYVTQVAATIRRRRSAQ